MTTVALDTLYIIINPVRAVTNIVTTNTTT